MTLSIVFFLFFIIDNSVIKFIEILSYCCSEMRSELSNSFF